MLSLKETIVPRFLVHVNRHQKLKRICVHCETNGPCSTVFLNVKKGERQGVTFHITKLDKATFRTADVSHSYWLIIWSKDVASVLKSRWVQKAQTKHRIPKDRVKECGHCNK